MRQLRVDAAAAKMRRPNVLAGPKALRVDAAAAKMRRPKLPRMCSRVILRCALAKK